MMTRTWTPEELLTLRTRYSSSDPARLARTLKRSTAEIERKASRLALGKNKAAFEGQTMPRWTPEDIATLRELYPTTSNREIAIRLHRSAKSVSSKAALLGLEKAPERLAEMGRANRTGRTRKAEA